MKGAARKPTQGASGKGEKIDFRVRSVHQRYLLRQMASDMNLLESAWVRKVILDHIGFKGGKVPYPEAPGHVTIRVSDEERLAIERYVDKSGDEFSVLLDEALEKAGWDPAADPSFTPRHKSRVARRAATRKKSPA